MSENLIYGADITAYGAVGDGVTDCSGAFAEAFKNGESLISVPYGNYVLKNPIVLNSNTQIHVHPNAIITFSPEKSGTYPMIYAESCGSIIISSGIFKLDACVDEKASFFSFKEVYGIRICGCAINSGKAAAISLEDCQCVTISDVKLSSSGNGIEILGDTEDVTVKKVTSDALSASFISFGNASKSCTLTKMQIRNISAENGHIIFDFLNGKAEDLRFESINASFGEDFLKVGEAFALDDAELEEITAYHLSESESDESAYFRFCGSCDSFEIRNFKRDASKESFPPAPTLVFKDSDRAKILIDGIALDNVIAARGKSKSVAMTTARLTNPWGRFTYTLECGVESGDTLSIPLGDFEYFRQDKA